MEGFAEAEVEAEDEAAEVLDNDEDDAVGDAGGLLILAPAAAAAAGLAAMAISAWRRCWS